LKRRFFEKTQNLSWIKEDILTAMYKEKQIVNINTNMLLTFENALNFNYLSFCFDESMDNFYNVFYNLRDKT